MLDAWIESVFLKRALLSFASAAAAYVAAHSLPGLDKLSLAGVTVTIQIDPKKLADWLAIFLVGIANGAHDWAAQHVKGGLLMGRPAPTLSAVPALILPVGAPPVPLSQEQIAAQAAAMTPPSSGLQPKP